MSRSQVALLCHAAILIAAMFAIVPVVTRWQPQLGYLASLALYWLGFCLPVVALHVWKRHDGRLFSERLAWRDWWIPFLLMAQVVAIAIAAFYQNTTHLTTHGAMLAAAVAIINGPLEEAAWRGGFMVRFAHRPKLGFWLGWLLFSAWHIPLAFSHGVVFDGGWISLVGGAAALGLLWSWIAWRTGSVFWVAIAHVLTNVLTFWVFFDRNGFV